MREGELDGGVVGWRRGDEEGVRKGVRSVGSPASETLGSREHSDRMITTVSDCVGSNVYLKKLSDGFDYVEIN